VVATGSYNSTSVTFGGISIGNSTGNDIYGAALPEAGEYALVYSKLAHAREPIAGADAEGNHGLIIGLFVMFFLLFCVVFAVRARAHEVDP